MNDNATNLYHTRFARVFDYIDQHLADDLSVELLGQVANFSKFHSIGSLLDMPESMFFAISS